jgi:hypothetical protein
MEDTTSLVLQMKALSVNTAPLEAILLNIFRTLQNHDVVVSKLPTVETNLSDLRKELNKLKIALEATSARDDEKETNRSVPNSSPTHNTTTSSNNYGVRKADIDPIHCKLKKDNASANEVTIANGLREVKATIRRLQQDRDEGLANSMETDDSIKSLKEGLTDLQQKLISSVTTTQLQMLQQSLSTKYDQIEQNLNEFQSSFRGEVDESINQNLFDVKTWFKELEGLVKQRQAKLETRVTSCAKEYDVVAFRESVDVDLATLMRKASFLDDTAKAQGKTIVSLQQKTAIALLHRNYIGWKEKALKVGTTRWKQVVQRQVKYEQEKVLQKRLVKKVLTQIMSRRKRCGFDKWIRYRNWQRKTERRKLKASTLICERLALILIAPKASAFNKWRRLTVMDKMKCTYEAEDGRVDQCENDVMESNTFAQPAHPTDARRQTGYDMNDILHTLKSDAHGSSCALAQEIDNIKSRDIASLRRDLATEKKNIIASVHNNVDVAIHKVEEAAKTFQLVINQRVDSCEAEFPPIHFERKELTHLFKTNEAQLKNVKESHGKRLDILFDKEEKLAERMSATEDVSRSTFTQVSSLLEEKVKSNKAVEYLRQVIATNEERHQEERKALQEVMNHFGDELLKTKVTLGHTQVRCENLEQELSQIKQDLSYFQDTYQSESEKVQDLIHHPGIQKPNLDRIVRVGHSYENLAKEKNYVTGINVMTTLTNVVTAPLKSKGERRRHKEEIDLPAEIAAFAHDYAEWIAYHANHESLLRLIVGTNPDEHVYAEDDLIAKRKCLIEELKTSLSSELERVTFPGVVNSPESSTRGLGLRWEARAIFLPRVIDAVKAALSKHDQIVLPSSTRLGRVRPEAANVIVCVACDRPMRQNRKNLSSLGDDSVPLEGRGRLYRFL